MTRTRGADLAEVAAAHEDVTSNCDQELAMRESHATRIATPVWPTRARALQPGSLDTTHIEGGFWGERQILNRAATLPHEVRWLEKFGTLGNFDSVAAGTIGTHRAGREFSDSDVYKVLEALTWEAGRSPSPEIENVIATLAARVAQAMDDDGYLNTQFGHEGQKPRYSDMEWGHELYCYGHLIQAGVARLRTGHDASDPLVALALRVADHTCTVFGENGLHRIDGHPVIEVALVELYRATGEERYLHQARLFIERRGHHTLADIEFGRTYFQDEVPVRDIEVLHGHAVRALYFAAGSIDAAVETADDDLFERVESQYAAALARRTYITGGMGAHHQDEAFGADFELPSDRAYCETCAGIGSIMVAWRLLLATGDLCWGDVIERTLYNIVATSLSSDGQAFFYANTLHQRELTHATDPDSWSPRASNAERSAWFEVSCCPPNVSRTIAQLASYVATHTDDGVQIVQYMSSDIRMEIPAGPVHLRVETDYPNDSRVAITVVEAPEQWTLSLRIPQWAMGATVAVSGRGTSEAANPGTFSLDNVTSGDVVVLTIPLEPRFTFPDERVDAIRGCVAVERGPLVYCVESVAQKDRTDVADIAVDVESPLTWHDGVVVARGVIAENRFGGNWPYAAAPGTVSKARADIVFSPYYAWGESGSTTMRVWVPVA